jgi:hypothetical protein
VVQDGVSTGENPPRRARVGSGGRRAPRLGPDTRIASHFTRRGRFRKVDPTKGRPLPSAARLLGAVGWAALVAESLRRAWKAARR